MGSSPDSKPYLSVVITVRNEENHLRQLLDSLLLQEEPYEVVLVDALSQDRSFEIAQEYADRAPKTVHVFQRFGSRGIGRNAGVRASKGEFVAFIDGDCFADTQWLRSVRRGLPTSDIVAGRTVTVGRPQWSELERIELFQRGNDVTYPSCNLCYRRSLFDTLRGFDPRFITAEDIDLNLRAVESGAKITYVPDAVVYHHTRMTVLRFLYQAFWNGYGRKQLTEKHGTLWGRYRYRRLLQGQRTPVAWARLLAALSGYFTRVLTGTGSRLTPQPAEMPTPSAIGATR